MMKPPSLHLSVLIFFTALFISCETDEVGAKVPDEGLEAEEKENYKIFENKSAISPLVKIFPKFNNLEAYSLVSTTDTIGDNFQLAGSADGAGLLKDENGYIYVVNNEKSFAVSRIRFDKDLNPLSGDYLLNSGTANYARQCSGTMWEAAIHGGNKDLFLSASETFYYNVKGINPRIETPTPLADFSLSALGKFHWENAVPLPKETYPGKTVIIGGDDDSNGSMGQVALYYSENGDDDLENGKVYVLRTKEISNGAGTVKDAASNEIYTEANFDFGITYEIEFVEIEDAKNLTMGETENACIDLFANQFMRVEDLDYQKGHSDNARNIFFAATGRGPGTGTYNDWGTVYKLELDRDNPLTGKITQIVSGNTSSNNRDGNLAGLQNPDNICVTENYVYIQEDPISFSKNHPAYIYQSDLMGNNIKKVLELEIRAELHPDGSSDFEGEFGSLIDVSEKVGIPGTFILALQPHYWEASEFKGLDGHSSTVSENDEGSQIVLLQGLPR